MYTPVKDGIDKAAKSVVYLEEKPPGHLCDVVHCFWVLKTETPLPEDFRYHVLPDACVNLLFDQFSPDIAAVTALNTSALILNLGRVFHFVGVQLLPGVWQGDPRDIKKTLVDRPYVGHLPLVAVNKTLIGKDFAQQQAILTHFIEDCVRDGLVAPNLLTATLLQNLNQTKTVADMAALTGVSPRQLQRSLKRLTGFAPHDFLKVLRIQQSFRQDYLTYYADQSHYIHSFRKVTGYTPTQYIKKFDV